jgi:hypothetical protein
VLVERWGGQGTQKPDRRADLRADVELEAHYRTAQEFTAAYVRNISGGNSPAASAIEIGWTSAGRFASPDDSGGGLGLVALLVFKTSVAPNPC